MELITYVAHRLELAIADPHDNLLGDLATACTAGEPDTTTAQFMLVTLFSAGGESTASLIGSATHIIATRPEIEARLRENPDLIPAFLEEVLRFEPPFRGHYRHVLNDCTLNGHDLPAGCCGEPPSRGPAHFEAPDEFRLDRPKGQAHIAFGKGAHFCVGAALARLEARIVLEHLLRNTVRIEAAETGRWLPSLLVRRLESLVLSVE